MLHDPRMKFWITKKVFEVRQGETLEESAAKETKPENLKFEIKDSDGKWQQVPNEYFETAPAKELAAA